jgi:hypothetical protein
VVVVEEEQEVVHAASGASAASEGRAAGRLAPAGLGLAAEAADGVFDRDVEPRLREAAEAGAFSPMAVVARLAWGRWCSCAHAPPPS